MSANDPITEDAIATPVPTGQAKAMGFWGHIDELRGTLVKCTVTFLIFAVLIGIFMKEFNDLLLWPLQYAQKTKDIAALDLGTTSVMEGFTVIIQMCALGGLLLAAPFCLYFIGQFIGPALTPKELRLVLPLCCVGALLFLIGALFGFFLLVPGTIRVSIEINQMFGYVMRWTPGSYYGLLTWLVLGVGGSFEFPLLVFVLVYLGILQTTTLRKYRRHAIVAIFILAAVVTPTPDPVTQVMFAVPLYLLFEVAIMAGARVEKARRARALSADGG